jgi:hypothetical protein
MMKIKKLNSIGFTYLTIKTKYKLWHFLKDGKQIGN